MKAHIIFMLYNSIINNYYELKRNIKKSNTFKKQKKTYRSKLKF